MQCESVYLRFDEQSHEIWDLIDIEDLIRVVVLFFCCINIALLIYDHVLAEPFDLVDRLVQ